MPNSASLTFTDCVAVWNSVDLLVFFDIRGQTRLLKVSNLCVKVCYVDVHFLAGTLQFLKKVPKTQWSVFGEKMRDIIGIWVLPKDTST